MTRETKSTTINKGGRPVELSCNCDRDAKTSTGHRYDCPVNLREYHREWWLKKRKKRQ